MHWHEKRYHTLDYELKKLFRGKTAKLSIDGGFTCPNRDGTISISGCNFCDSTGAGGFATKGLIEIHEQIEQQIELVSKKWDPVAYIAYFQRFTNTYADVDTLRKIYNKALSHPKIRGVAIATRPDCMDEEKCQLIAGLNSQLTWVEFGLQSIHNETAEIINRGYKLKRFEQAVKQLDQQGIKLVVHVIFGLPNETKEMMLKTVRYLAQMPIWGIKIHMLNVVEGTLIAKQFQKQPFQLITKEEYIELVCDTIEILPQACVIHRLTGDADHNKLIEPNWIKHKLGVLSGIDMLLKKRDSFQGKFHSRN